MNFYLTDANRLLAVRRVLKFLETHKEESSFYSDVNDICRGYVKYGRMTEKQEALVARVYFCYCDISDVG